MTDILVPVAELQQATAALNAVAAQVRTDHKAMSEWATTQADFVTVKDEAGLDVQVPSLDKLNRDVSGLETDVRALVGEMYARPISEFYAERERNLKLFAASGMVRMGRHRDNGGSLQAIGEGLYTYTSTPNSLRLGALPTTSSVAGSSETHHPETVVAGLVSKLIGLNASVGTNAYAQFQFPAAPDGKTTYHKSTGEVVTHSSVDAAFDAAAINPDVEVVTERVDLFGVEVWLEKVTDAHPFIYPYGMVGSALTDMDGYGTTNDNRPESYHAQHPGHTGMARRGVNTKTISAAQLAAHLSNPDHGVYRLATGEIVQLRARGKTYAGAGNGDWSSISSLNNTLQFGTASDSRVGIQGAADVPYGWVGSGAANHFRGIDRLGNRDKSIFSVYSPDHLADSIAVNGECYFLVMGTYERLNKGAYHPSLNPCGTDYFVRYDGAAVAPWYAAKLVEPTSARDCFIPKNGYPATAGFRYGFGYLGSGMASGRPDGRYYDVVYPGGLGGVTDLRLEARRQTQADHSRVDAMVKAGTYRGLETVVKTNAIVANGITTAASGSLVKIKVSDVAGSFSTRAASSSPVLVSGTLIVDGTPLAVKKANYVPASSSPSGQEEYWIDVGQSVGGAKSVVGCFGEYTNLSVSGEFTWCTVIGNPAILAAAADLKDGWLGDWCPVIPNGTTRTFPLGRKSLGVSTRQYSLDGGVTWTSTSSWIGVSYSDVTNSISGGAAADTVYVLNYTAWANMTEPCASAKIRDGLAGLGDVFASDCYLPTHGAALGESLISKVLVTNTNYQSLPLTQFGVRPDNGQLYTGNTDFKTTKHAPITMLGTADRPGFKALRYGVEDEGLATNVYAFAELGFDGDWGDSGIMPIKDNDSTWVDDNGHTRKAGTHKLSLPFGWV